MDRITNPKISICVPIHWMKNWQFFLTRCLESIERQTYKNYEIIIIKKDKMAETSNATIKKATGDIIKILYMDDFLAHPDSLAVIAKEFKGGWLATGCLHSDGRQIRLPHLPTWSERVKAGENTIGSPSVISIENKDPLLFDENLNWLLDCELYGRLFERYGEPTLINDLNVVMGTGEHQMTHILTDKEKLDEHIYITQKYENKTE